MDPGRERELQGSAAPDIMLATQLELAKSRETHNILPLEIHHPKYMGDTPQQTYGAAAKHLLSLHSNGRYFQPALQPHSSHSPCVHPPPAAAAPRTCSQ